jgi:hypothetical protein
MNFNDAAIAEIFDKVVSYAMTTGRFDRVNQHEPTNAPGGGVTCSIWVDVIRPVMESGLASTSGILQLNARVYQNFKSMPHDLIDPKITAAVCDIIGALSADFDFGGAANVRNIDLLGQHGVPLAARAGYIELDRQMNRVMTITIPIIINDMWTQEG